MCPLPSHVRRNPLQPAVEQLHHTARLSRRSRDTRHRPDVLGAAKCCASSKDTHDDDDDDFPPTSQEYYKKSVCNNVH
jgi:hypothetical protein